MQNSNNFRVRAYKNAIDSDFLTAILFGIISPNISNMIVPVIVAIITDLGPSPIKLATKVVIIAVKATFTRLLPSNIVDKSRSVFAIIAATRFAPGFLLLIKYDKRVFWSDKKAASELEKKAENTRNINMRVILVTISYVKVNPRLYFYIIYIL